MHGKVPCGSLAYLLQRPKVRTPDPKKRLTDASSVILVDANLLLYAGDSWSGLQRASQPWWRIQSAARSVQAVAGFAVRRRP